jgi:hypothetical protein
VSLGLGLAAGGFAYLVAARSLRLAEVDILASLLRRRRGPAT